MAKPPGLAVYHGRSITHESDGTAAPGDALFLNGGQVAQAFDDGTTVNPTFGGILSHTNDTTHDAGDNVSVEVGGVVIANVAAGVTAGTELGASATAGELAAGGADIWALSDEGGTYRGATLDAGYAAVYLG